MAGQWREAVQSRVGRGLWKNAPGSALPVLVTGARPGLCLASGFAAAPVYKTTSWMHKTLSWGGGVCAHVCVRVCMCVCVRARMCVLTWPWRGRPQGTSSHAVLDRPAGSVCQAMRAR